MISGKQFAGRRIQGTRDYQEDDFGFLDAGDGDDPHTQDLLMVLADGMGGHSGGAAASAVAVETFIAAYAEGRGSAAERMSAALACGNRSIGARISDEPDLEGMGCTLVGVALSMAGVDWISVGDSPLWLLRDGTLRRLNADHSMAPVLQQQVQRGELSARAAEFHPSRNMLRSAVTGGELSLIDQSEMPLPLQAGDRLLLASDGLLTLGEEEVGHLLGAAGRDADAITADLLAAIEDRDLPNQDNTTVLVALSPADGVLPIGSGDPSTRRIERDLGAAPRRGEGPSYLSVLTAIGFAVLAAALVLLAIAVLP